MKKTLFTVSANAIALALTFPAQAQTAATAATTDQVAAPAETPAQIGDDPQAEPASDIVVTGTRVTRAGYDQPTPTTVLNDADLNKRGLTNVADLLNTVPAFGLSTTPTTTARSSQNAGGNFVNLRGLGIARTLVLVNGRRHVPTTAGGQVDINVIPSSMIERVDVVTGGASAAYGSDAVAGVVNIILKRNIDGIQGSIQGQVSEFGDGQDYNARLAFGHAFADGRLRFNIAGEYDDYKGIGRGSERDWAAAEYDVLGNPAYTPTNGQPQRILSPNVHLSTAAPGGLITSGPLRGTLFLPNGATTTFNYGTSVGSTYMIGGDGVNGGRYASTLATPLDRQNVFSRLAFDASDNIELFAEASYARSHTRYDLSTSYDLGTLTIRRDNAFLPTAVAQRLSAAGAATFTLGRLNDDIAWNVDEVTNQTQRYVVGADGKFGAGWTWTAYYQYGKTDYDAYIHGNRINANFTRAVDAVVNPANGQIVCRSTLTDPTNGCVPINLFGYGSPSAAARAYVTGTQSLNADIREDAAGASIQGEPFSLWAGPVSVAFGGEYRREAVTQTVDAISAASGFFTGNPKPLNGSYNVKEGFFETVIPLLSKSAAGSLDLNGAVRYTDYSTSGAVTTWKGGATWKLLGDQVMLRATRSRDIRAPSVNELFSSTILTFATIVDPVTGQQVTIQSPTSGNTALTPEKADTLTAGISVQPQALRGLQLSVDYYDIKLRDAISTLGALDIVTRCAAGNADLCALVTRDATNTLTAVRRPFINLAQLKTSGIDIEASYTSRLFGGTLSLRGLATYVDKLETFDGLTRINRAGDVGNGNAGLPHWRWTASTTYTNGPITGFLEGRYIGGGVQNATYTATSINDNRVASQFLLNGTLTFSAVNTGRGRGEFFLSVRNILNQDPPISPLPFIFTYPTNSSLYDVTGRTFVAGFRVRY